MTHALLRRVAVPPGLQGRSQHVTLPAPVKGWVTNEAYAEGDVKTARVMDDVFCEFDGVRFRGGIVKSATIGTDPVTALFRYIQGGVEKLFACSDSDIYNITGLDPDNAPTADVGSQTSGYYSVAQMGTSGGDYLYACNEADKPELYDGSSWTAVDGTSTPAITGVTTTNLRAVWNYRNRFYFIERDTLTAWALPTESIGGAAIEINLKGVFREGGNLLFGATWSLDSGEGQDDKCVFVTDLGEVAVYSGSDPSDANNWGLIGVYKTSEPLGKNGWTHIGGDLLIATVDGIIPLTQIIARGPEQTSLAAITRKIEPDWKREASIRSASYPWEMHRWPERKMMIVALPHTVNEVQQRTFVINTETGAWQRWTGLDVQCLSMFGDNLYCGDTSGSIHKMDSTGSDNGTPYSPKIGYAWNHLKQPGVTKTALLMRATYLTVNAFNVNLRVSVDYVYNFGSAPSAAAEAGGSTLWDDALWDVGIWDEGASGFDNATAKKTRWVSVYGEGYAHAPCLIATIGNTNPPNSRLIAVDLVYQTGGLVV